MHKIKISIKTSQVIITHIRKRKNKEKQDLKKEQKIEYETSNDVLLILKMLCF